MNKLLSVLMITSLFAAQSVYAAISIINNEDGNIEIQYSHCDNSKMCNFSSKQQFNQKGQPGSFVAVLAPVGMATINITSAKLYDNNQNTVATLATDCQLPVSSHSNIILDSFGTSKIHCLYVDG